MGDEANLVAAYRAARRAFIAACESAQADDIARVHPARGPDGKPLFCDSAAFGPRLATRGLVLIADGGGAIHALIGQAPKLPKDARLVAIHALDPYARAFGKPGQPADWPAKTLATIVGEDLAKAKKLTLLDLEGILPDAMVVAALPGIAVTYRQVKPEHAQQAFLAAIAAL